ncbi:tRNA (adenine-N1)-methyltransferase [Schaalia sp. 19OD2882]|uniref:tRNA (adenine-N1)-methyltransferase n=1 Tax=Schaalia sp. 19OD2882 TaxID=2794089 RepID=UPI001C1ED190|nr:tRNA (adenine-N1)-methyltransferase [Schaalia sp. 19OD2882]QWW18725.1 tRNA (adenine-N1)-methyltransferase [Schaalia sp. 19OD2882]
MSTDNSALRSPTTGTPDDAQTLGPIGQQTRRGPLREGDRVQIKDPKGRLHTITLVKGGYFQTNRGDIHHDDLIGRPDGQVLTTAEGRQFQVLRPLRHDYVMGMPRGAAVVYPKDAGTIVHYGDIFPGAVVVEAGAGSGALSLALLDAVGPTGRLVSVERREDFADIARANVDLWFGRPHPAWDLRVGDVAEELAAMDAGTVDRVVLDMLAPWENIEAVARALVPGGVVVCYVATVTQMSRLVEDLRRHGGFTDPEAWETLARGWHLDGLAVRPDHRMVAHTGFLLTTRRLAPGVSSQERSTRPSPSAEGKGGMWDQEEAWSDAAVGQRVSSPKKVRKVRRDLAAKSAAWVRGDQDGAGPDPDGTRTEDGDE